MQEQSKHDQETTTPEKPLIEQIADWDNLLNAYKKARKRKKNVHEIEAFGADLWLNLGNIQLHLLAGTYEIGRYRQFVVYEPQKRLILAPTFRDRVVHHAILNILEEPWDKRMIEDTNACRKGKGTHSTAKRIQFWLRNMVKNQPLHELWIVKTDYSKYFPSLRHDILKRIAAKNIKCPLTIKIIYSVIDSVPDPGLPIGSLLSQWLANLAGNEVDQYVKRKMRVKRYIRYMDDTAAIFSSRIEAELYLAEFTEISEKLSLTFSKFSIHRASQGINMVGYRIWPTHMLLRKRSIVQFRRDIKRIKKRYTDPAEQERQLVKRVNSFIAHAKHADTYRIRRKLINEAFK